MEMKAILEPEAFVKYLAGDIVLSLQGCKGALLCFDPRNFYSLKNLLPGREIKGLSCRAWLTENNVLLCGRIGIGAPAAAALLEELAAIGIRKIVSFGTAGALHQGLEPGDLVLCTESFVDEGTSGHYLPGAASGKPGENLTSNMEKHLLQSNVEFHSCKAWTTDAPFRETVEKLSRFLSLGADVVEMEASALFNVAAFRGIDLAAVFVIGDSIADGVWKPYFKDDLVINRMNHIGLILVEFLSLIAHG
jgi:uridine phosphorylase